MTVSPVGQGRVRGRWLAASSGFGVGLGRGVFSDRGLGASNAGAGNFQPSVDISSASLPSERVQGGSPSRRASRTAMGNGRSKPGSASTWNGIDRSMDQSGSTARHSHLARFGNGFANSAKWFEQ